MVRTTLHELSPKAAPSAVSAAIRTEMMTGLEPEQDSLAVDLICVFVIVVLFLNPVQR